MFKTLQTRIRTWYRRGETFEWDGITWENHTRSPAWKVHRVLTWLRIRR